MSALPDPQLTAVEARALACLVEKAATTPDAYPLTLNALVLACNQKTSRDPVLDLDPGEVGHALRTLEDKRLVKVVHGSRALRYEHRIDEVYTITPRQRALLTALMLRGPQTQGELHARSERLAEFPAPEDVHDTLERLCHRDPPLARRLPRGPGQREDRYVHLLSGEPSADLLAAAATSTRGGDETAPRADADGLAALEARVSALEAELADLRRTVAGLTGPPDRLES